MILDRTASRVSNTDLSRRNFLVGSAAAGGGVRAEPELGCAQQRGCRQ